MDASTYQLVKLRYKFFFAGIIILGIVISIYPTMQISPWLANALNYDMQQPARDSLSGIFWSLGFLVTGLVNIALCSSIVIVLVSKINGWNLNQAMDIFVRNKYPRHWFKEL